MEIDALISRVRGEFREMPGLRLTMPQAMRLWGLERASCQRIVQHLIDSSFLQWGSRGEPQPNGERSFFARSDSVG